MKNNEKELLHDIIMGWYDDIGQDYDGPRDINFISHICKSTGMTEETYHDIMGKANSDANLLEGHTYRFGDYYWVVAEIKDGCAVLQSTGVTSGKWPGYVMPEFGNGNWYGKNIDGLDISNYDVKMSALYKCIKDAEFTSADYGKGLFLVSNEKAGQTEWGLKGSDNYWSALKRAAENYSSLGASNYRAWLGTYSGSGSSAYYVNSDGSVSSSNQDYSNVVAPAFNLDQSKIEVNGDEIVIL